MCRMRNIAMCDYQESVTTGQTDRQTPDKVIPYVPICFAKRIIISEIYLFIVKPADCQNR